MYIGYDEDWTSDANNLLFTFKKITRQLDLPLFGLGYSPCTIEHQTI